MLTKIREKGAIAETKVWVESDTVKHLKAFKIIPGEIPIAILIQCWWYFSCLCIQKFCFIHSHITSKIFLKFLCPRYIGQLFRKIIVC